MLFPSAEPHATLPLLSYLQVQGVHTVWKQANIHDVVKDIVNLLKKHKLLHIVPELEHTLCNDLQAYHQCQRCVYFQRWSPFNGGVFSTLNLTEEVLVSNSLDLK